MNAAAEPVATIRCGAFQVLGREGETVLDALRRSGIKTTYGCQRGGCGVCKIRILDGEVVHRPLSRRALPIDDERTGVALSCRAVPVGDIEVEPLDGRVSASLLARAISSAGTNKRNALAADHPFTGGKGETPWAS